jgi:threonine dehydratase
MPATLPLPISHGATVPRVPPIDTFAGGLATGQPFMLPQQLLCRYPDDFVLVADDEMRCAVRLHLDKAKTLAEPAGAAPLAAALRLREASAGKTVALILSGGNISAEELLSCFENRRVRKHGSA